MMRVGILGLWPSAIVRKITRGDKGNWPRKRDRWRHEASAAMRARAQLRKPRRPGPTSARVDPVLNAGLPARRWKTSPPSSKVAHYPRKSPQTRPLRRSKPCRSRGKHASPPWSRLGRLGPESRPGVGSDRPDGKTPHSDQPETTGLGDGASNWHRHGPPTAGTEDVL
jgi:hypothetical protein